MAISTEDVRHVARLARIRMTDDEIGQMTGELDVILEHVGAIARLDLADIPPTTHVVDVTNVLGDDVPHESLSTVQALANAPDPADHMFRVPRMES